MGFSLDMMRARITSSSTQEAATANSQPVMRYRESCCVLYFWLLPRFSFTLRGPIALSLRRSFSLELALSLGLRRRSLSFEDGV